MQYPFMHLSYYSEKLGCLLAFCRIIYLKNGWDIVDEYSIYMLIFFSFLLCCLSL